MRSGVGLPCAVAEQENTHFGGWFHSEETCLLCLVVEAGNAAGVEAVAMRVFHPQPGEMVQPSSTVDLLLSSVKSTQRLAKGQHGAVVEHELEGTAHEEEEETSEQAQLRRWQESQQELKAWRQKSLYRLRRLEQGQEEEEGEAEWRRLQRRQQEEEWLQRVLSLEEIRSSEVLAESLASLKDPAVLSSTKTQQLGGNSPSPTTGGSTGPTEKVTMVRVS